MYQMPVVRTPLPASRFTSNEERALHGAAIMDSIGAGGRAWLFLGKTRRLRELLEGTTYLAASPFYLAHLGNTAEAVNVLEEVVLARPGIGTAEDETAEFSDVMSLEAAVLVGHRKAAELLLDRLSDSGKRTTGWYHPTVIARHLGAAAASLGRPEEARAHYRDALKVATDMRFRPEIALTRLQLAELLLEHYPDEKTEALEHLDFAIGEFREMKMQPSLERALKHKEILGA